MGAVQKILIYNRVTSLTREIALSFQAAGHHVAYSREDPECLSRVVSYGPRYDMVIATEPYANRFRQILQQNPNIAWDQHFGTLVVIQFHDIAQELSHLIEMHEACEGFNLGFAYWAYCSATVHFLKSIGARFKIIHENLPIVAERELVLPDAEKKLIPDVSSYVRAKSFTLDNEYTATAGAPAVIFFGQCSFPSAYNPLWVFPEDAPVDYNTVVDALNRSLAASLAAGVPVDRLGFCLDMVASGTLPVESFAAHAAQCINIYARLVVEQARQKFCQMLRSIYGPRFALYGGGWHTVGLESFPDCWDTDAKYQEALIAIDFGSLFLDTSLYTRSHEVVVGGGRLLQLKQADSVDAYGPFHDLVCFSDAPGMLTRIEAALSDPKGFNAAHRELRAYLTGLGEYKAIGRRVVDTALS